MDEAVKLADTFKGRQATERELNESFDKKWTEIVEHLQVPRSVSDDVSTIIAAVEGILHSYSSRSQWRILTAELKRNPLKASFSTWPFTGRQLGLW